MNLPRHLLNLNYHVVASFICSQEFLRRPEGYKEDTYKLMEELEREIDKLKE